jgi:RimJ/RimL family protein N-acetyltransferase
MAIIPILETERLRLRGWRDGDRRPFAALNGDVEAMRFFPRPLAPGESDALIDRLTEGWRDRGFGVWAVERREDGAFVGAVGLAKPNFTAFFTPCVEMMWRLSPAHWGRGYAVEAARASARFAFDRLSLSEVVAFTFTGNQPSRRVMERLGMTHDPAEGFDYPTLPADHPLRPHVLYRLSAR